MRKKILIAEDDISLLKALSAKLKQLGYTVFEAKNGKEAIQIFSNRNPDLILLDIIMPEKTGFEVLRDIRKKYESDVPIIILSNLEKDEDLQKGKKLGIVDYIVKSNVSLRNLMTKIHTTLSN